MTATEQDAPAVLEADARPSGPPSFTGERSVYERVLAIIGELPAIGKTQRNEQQKFMFRGHDDVMNALNPLLARHGVFIAPSVLERVTGERTTNRGATMYEVNLHVLFTFYGAGGDYFQASGWGEGTDMGDKATSKAMTMAFKYVLAEVFALATAEVSDADTGSPEETTKGTGGKPARQPRPENEPRRKQEFDPAKHMLDGAIIVREEKDADDLAREINSWDPDQDWNAVEEYVLLHLFGKPYDELDGKQKREYYTRLANAVVKVGDLSGGGDFPPPELAVVEDAWAWAFNGVQIALAAPEPDADGPEVPAEPEPDAEPENGVQGDDAAE